MEILNFIYIYLGTGAILTYVFLKSIERLMGKEYIDNIIGDSLLPVSMILVLAWPMMFIVIFLEL